MESVLDSIDSFRKCLIERISEKRLNIKRFSFFFQWRFRYLFVIARQLELQPLSLTEHKKYPLTINMASVLSDIHCNIIFPNNLFSEFINNEIIRNVLCSYTKATTQHYYYHDKMIKSHFVIIHLQTIYISTKK